MCAGKHAAVVAQATNAFNKILAFFVGAALTLWVAGLAGVTGSWFDQPSRYRRMETLIGEWAQFAIFLVLGILFVGVLTTMADIRENLRILVKRQDGSLSAEQRVSSRPAPTPVREDPSFDFPIEPDYTDEEKMELAQELARNAQLAAMPVGIDEDSPTDP
jgi:hypothetical protein